MEHETESSKIEDTVRSILKEADHEHATELSVRAEASARLGLDLSGLAHKNLVRHVLETYLLSLEPTTSDVERESGVKEPTKNNNNELELDARDGLIICKLSERRGVSVHGAKGESLVSIRDYYPKHGKLVYSSRGISLSSEQWSAFRKSVPDIEAAITKMESRIRSEDASKISKAHMTNSTIPVGQRPPQDSIHTRANISNTFLPYSSPRGLVPIQTPRFDGKNYHCWVHLMEFFLKQMNIAYVLTEPCPISPLSPEAAIQKWIDDDYICRHSILNSLCDHLFEKYSTRTNNAKELWKELKLTYDDDVGTTRSQVNKYIQFQMVDGISVLEQVQELHKIADSITASGVSIDEKFHVSVVVSKLPPSWKECRSKLMQEDFLPLNMLMHRLRLEEEARNRAKKEEFFIKARLEEEARNRAKKEEFFIKTRVGVPRKEDKFRPKNKVWRRPGDERATMRP